MREEAKIQPKRWQMTGKKNKLLHATIAGMKNISQHRNNHCIPVMAISRLCDYGINISANTIANRYCTHLSISVSVAANASTLSERVLNLCPFPNVFQGLCKVLISNNNICVCNCYRFQIKFGRGIFSYGWYCSLSEGWCRNCVSKCTYTTRGIQLWNNNT